MDKHSPSQRSYNMSRIKSKNTKPEIVLRKWLWSNGYRYRLHVKELPGKPDIVFPKYKAIIFVQGCFWHQHGCRFTVMPSTRKQFWENKLKANVERDKQNNIKLESMGWRVLVAWECALTGRTIEFEKVGNRIVNWLKSDEKHAEVGEME